MLLLLLRQPTAGGRRLRRPDQTRTFLDARVKWVRDRALDHAVEKEKHLLPFHNLKDLLLSSASSHSLPLSSISSHSHHLLLPFRPIRFIRLFPSAFLEEFPAGTAAPDPHIRPTPALLRLHADEERAIHDSRSDAADRLLCLLMLTPGRRLPLHLIDHLRWDLGLPRDYPKSLLPDFPDYFRVIPSPTAGTPDLELVWYSKDLAVSSMERRAFRTGYKKGMPLGFHLQYPRGFNLEKKVKAWVDEWQKLPYISPYEDGSRLMPKSDVAEKWTVGVLHELLHLLIGKKTEKNNLILLCQHVGLQPGFRKVIANHPGIFYVSNKLGTETVVLREAYHRDRLLETHPLMGLRYQYIHLMHKGKETTSSKKDKKSKRATSGTEEHSSDENQDVEDEDDDDYEDGKYEAEEEEDDDDEEIMSVSETEDEESDDEYVDINATKGTALSHVPGTRRAIKVKEDMQRRPFSPKMSSIEKRLHTSKTNVGKKSNQKANRSLADQRPSFKRKASI